MIGIIYKFTIVCGKVKKRNKCPFYIGQHWEKISVENFLSKSKCSCYTGGGVHWNKFINKLRILYPIGRWRNFIHREVLYAKEGISQKALDVLEAHYIKKYKSHYSYGLGGCNIAWGSVLNGENPSKDPIVAAKISKALSGRKFSEEHRKKLRDFWTSDRLSGDKNPNYGHRWTDEMKKDMSEKKIGVYVGDKNPNYGNKWSKEQREVMSKKMKQKYANTDSNPNPMFGKKRITNGVINTIIPANAPLPEGFRYGMISKEDRKPLSPFMWITNNKISKRVPKNSVIPEGWRRGSINSFNRYKYENQVIKS